MWMMSNRYVWGGDLYSTSFKKQIDLFLNASGNRLISFLNEVELVICNGRQLVPEPEWTRVLRPSLNQMSVIDQMLS